MPENNYQNTSWTNVGNGCIIIEKELDKKDVQGILKESHLSRVILSCKPSLRTFELLNNYLFNPRPDVWFRPTPFFDFAFLESMTNLEALHLDNYQIKSLHGIENLSNLKRLVVYDTKSKSISLKPISNLQQLKSLYISGHKKDIESISNLNKITELTLRSITIENLDFLQKFNHLEKLHVILGGTKNFSAIVDIPKLKIFELWHVQMLTDIEFISNLKALEYLHLSALRNIKKLPKFTYNNKLSKLVFDNLKGLEDISTLKNLQNLEELWFIAANNLTIEQFKVLQECHRLKMVSVGFGSDKRNKEFRVFLEGLGIKEYDWKKSKFQ